MGKLDAIKTIFRAKTKEARPTGSIWWRAHLRPLGYWYALERQATPTKVEIIGAADPSTEGYRAYYKRKFLGEYPTLRGAKTRTEKEHSRKTRR